MPEPSVSKSGKARATRRAVHFTDRLAESVITIGGFGVIVAVLGICVYLALTVVPLFRGGRVEPDLAGTGIATSIVAIIPDEYRRGVMVVTSDGDVEVVTLSNGKVIARGSVGAEGGRVTALSREPSTGLIGAGMSDGTVRLGVLEFASEILAPAEVAGEWRRLKTGELVAIEPSEDAPLGGFVECLPGEQFRRTIARMDMRAPAELETGSGAVVRIDYRSRGSNHFMVAVREDGTAVYETVRTSRPLGGGQARVKLETSPVPLRPPEGKGLPDWFLVSGDEVHALALWKDGYCQRYAATDPAEEPIVLAEEMQIVEVGRTVTSAAMTLGGLTLLVGDSAGGVTGVVLAVDPSATTPDAARMAVAHRFEVSDSAVTSIGVSTRDRSVAFGDASGRIALRNITSEKRVVPLTEAFTDSVIAAVPMPKLDGILAVSRSGEYRMWSLFAGHPEASFASLFGKLWYEGAPAPGYVYQSSGEDTAEVKLSLMPLILGTLKATVFAMIFAVPVGVLAAVYTSEFLDRGVRRVVKPVVEMMASLPSVVLGFVAAIVVAPHVRDWLPAILVGFGVVPLGMLFGAFLWQVMPPWVSRKVPPAAKLSLMFVVLFAGVGVSSLLGPWVERLLFVPTMSDRWVIGGSFEPVAKEERPAWVGGRKSMNSDEERKLRVEGLYFRNGEVVRPVRPADGAAEERVNAAVAASGLDQPNVRAWLDGNIGGAFPGWVLVMTAPAAVLVVVVYARVLGRRYGELAGKLDYRRAALLDLAKFVVGVGATLAVSVGLAALLTRAGVDSRDSIFGPFSQRNTLVVGLIMGFAVIPIIYTISEDAMSAVPDSLRSASLGAGATPWQTAVRVVLPVAASGIFSAVMIGLGRAAGETMIVVMATGNTPSMDWSLFSGFRTLSANIAVELPEAPRDGTHYRVLFLCGLVLFAMTFVINTTAEVVRQRFRRRSAAL